MDVEIPKTRMWFHDATGSVIYLRPVIGGGHGFHVKLRAGHLPGPSAELRETWHGEIQDALIRVAHLMDNVVPGTWTLVPDDLPAAAAPLARPAGEPGDWEELRQQAAQTAAAVSAMFAGDQAVTEATLAANGIRPVSVVHGDPETDEDADLISRLHRLAEENGPMAGYRGGNDHVTFLFNGPEADTRAAAFTAQALGIARTWWRITPTAHPTWR